MRLPAFLLAFCVAALSGFFLLVPPVRALPLSTIAPVVRVLPTTEVVCPPVLQQSRQIHLNHSASSSEGSSGCSCPICQQVGLALIQGRLPLSA